MLDAFLSRSTLVAVLKCVAVIAVAVVVVFVLQQHAAATRRTNSKNDLKQIMIAMHAYHDEYRSFPPAFTIGPDGKRWHSWRALILPYLDPELAKRYHFNEPWNGPHNRQLQENAPEVFRSDCVNPPANATSYFAVVGKRTLWPAHQSIGIQNITDGTSNTIAIVEDSKTNVLWLEPADLLYGEFLKSFYHGTPFNKGGARSVAIADGSVRVISPQLNHTILAGLLSPDFTSNTFRGDDWPADLIDTPVEQSLRSPVDVKTLRQTGIVAASTCDLDVTRNQIWAAPLQIVWDDLKNSVNGPVQLEDKPPLADLLNDNSFDLASLAPASYLVARTNAESPKDQELAESIRKKFPDVSYSLQPINKRPDQWGLRLFAMIRKRMPFESLFARFSEPLQFPNETRLNGESTTKPVNSFGQNPESDGKLDPRSLSHEPVYRNQLEILDDLGDDSFVIRLSTIGAQQDEIILAMTPPASTLEATWQAVKDRIHRPNPQHSRPVLEECETLQIPIMDFSLSHHFEELEDRSIDGFGDSTHLALAFIDIRLRLDETGADFMSASETAPISEDGGDQYDSGRIRRFIFNRPFFIAIKEPGQKSPFFMAWIANAELMETFAVRDP